jgi:PAS domain S-box-containing protein
MNLNLVKSSGSAHLLNINDDAATRFVMRTILETAGYSVIDAPDGTTGLTLARERPDLIILDVRLPDISGLEVCRRLKADPLTMHIPILQTSATFVSSERKVEGLDSGADAYLAQPIDDTELVAIVRAMLRTRRAEEAERLAALKWQSTFDAMSDGVFVLDSRRRIINCNRAMAKILDVSSDSVVGSSIAALFGERVTHELARAWLSDPLDPTVTRWEMEIQLRTRWYRMVADAAPDKEQRGLTVVVLSDITERKKLEEGYRRTAQELASAARRKDEFLAMLAHELRNPLNAIVAANALQETLPPADSESLRLRAIVARQTRHLARLVDDLLDVSRITRGEVQMRKAVVDLSEIIERVCDSQRAMLDTRKQFVTLSLPGPSIFVDGDEMRLEQVISNLLANAAKYSGAGSEIQVSLALEDGDGGEVAVTTITDQGVGIPHDMLDSVFDMFVQIDRSLARTLGGLGLGLTVVKHVVEQHGGDVRAHSAGLGKGATFAVRLPACVAPRDTVRPPALTVAAQRSPGLDILVIEDNDDTRDLVATLLETRGHRVQCAADGVEGVNMALESKPDVALIDIGLPQMNGYDVARRVRASASGGATYLVAVTGYGSPEDQARATEAGFDAHIVKPIDSQLLFDLLAHASTRSGSQARCAKVS